MFIYVGVYTTNRYNDLGSQDAMNERHGHTKNLRTCGIKSINTSRDLNLQLLFSTTSNYCFFSKQSGGVEEKTDGYNTFSSPSATVYLLLYPFLKEKFLYRLVDAYICSAKATRNDCHSFSVFCSVVTTKPAVQKNILMYVLITQGRKNSICLFLPMTGADCYSTLYILKVDFDLRKETEYVRITKSHRIKFKLFKLKSL